MIVTADNHLGRHYDRMYPQRLEQRRAWLRRGFAEAVAHALEQKAHLFLQAGDLFDSPEPRNAERQFVAASLADLRAGGVRCLAVGGNHDTPRARTGQAVATAQGSYARLGGLRLLGEPRTQDSGVRTRPAVLTPESLVLDEETLDIDGLRVAVGGMMPDPTAPAGSDPLEGVSWRPEADVALLTVHGSLEGHVYPGAPEPIIRRETVEKLEGVDCLLVGHVHRFAAFRWGGTAVVVPGATERMTFAESESRPGFVYMELQPGGPPAIRHVPVECQPRRQARVATSELGEGDPAEVVRARLEELCDRETMVRVSLEGPISRQRYHNLRLRELVEYGAERCFFLDLDTSGLFVEDEQRPTARGGRLSQREELLRYAGEVRDAASTEGERALIDEAVRAILEEYE